MGVVLDAPSQIDSLEQACAAVRAGLRTAVAGVVLEYNATTRQATVQPARRGRTAAGIPYDYAPVNDAPVLWPAFAGMTMVGRLNPGDPCLLLVHDRELAPFMLKPGAAPYDQTSPRTHDLSDAMVLPTLDPSVTPLTVGANGTEFYLGRKDGTAYLKFPIDVPGQLELEASALAGIRVGSSASEPAVLGTSLGTFLSELIAAGIAAAAMNDGGAAALAGMQSYLGLNYADSLSTKVVLE